MCFSDSFCLLLYGRVTSNTLGDRSTHSVAAVRVQPFCSTNGLFLSLLWSCQCDFWSSTQTRATRANFSSCFPVSGVNGLLCPNHCGSEQFPDVNSENFKSWYSRAHVHFVHPFWGSFKITYSTVFTWRCTCHYRCFSVIYQTYAH